MTKKGSSRVANWEMRPFLSRQLILKIIVVLLSFFLIFLAIQAFLDRYAEVSQSPAIPTFLPIEPSITPTRIPIRSGIWKVYQNKKYGFLVKYPEGFTYREFKGVALFGSVPGEQLAEFIEVGVSSQGGRRPSILIGYYKNKEKLELEDWFKQRSTTKDNFNNPDPEDADKLFWGVADIKKVNLGDLRGLVFKSSNSATDFQKTVLFGKDEEVFLLQSVTTMLGSFDGYLDLMIPTFKFISSESGRDPIEGQFCGGVAGNLPENQCPADYYCQIKEKFPDAGGVCVKKIKG